MTSPKLIIPINLMVHTQSPQGFLYVLLDSWSEIRSECHTQKVYRVFRFTLELQCKKSLQTNKNSTELARCDHISYREDGDFCGETRKHIQMTSVKVYDILFFRWWHCVSRPLKLRPCHSAVFTYLLMIIMSHNWVEIETKNSPVWDCRSSLSFSVSTFCKNYMLNYK